MAIKKETKADVFARVRSGDIRPEDMLDERPRVRRAAMVAMFTTGQVLDSEGCEMLLTSAAKDPSDVVHMSVHRAYLRSLVSS